MKIIKFKDKQYFINEEELVNHLRNNIKPRNCTDKFLVKESFKIGESKYVDPDLELLYGDNIDYEYWYEKLTDKVLEVPIEVVRHFDCAEVCDSFTIKKPKNPEIDNE